MKNTSGGTISISIEGYTGTINLTPLDSYLKGLKGYISSLELSKTSKGDTLITFKFPEGLPYPGGLSFSKLISEGLKGKINNTVAVHSTMNDGKKFYSQFSV